jgi:hypothetical protein
MRGCRLLVPSHVPTPDRSPTAQVNIKNLIDEVQCYETVRELRWPDGIACPSYQATQVIKESREMLGIMPPPASHPPQGPCPDTSA